MEKRAIFIVSMFVAFRLQYLQRQNKISEQIRVNDLGNRTANKLVGEKRTEYSLKSLVKILCKRSCYYCYCVSCIRTRSTENYADAIENMIQEVPYLELLALLKTKMTFFVSLISNRSCYNQYLFLLIGRHFWFMSLRNFLSRDAGK